MYYSWAWRSSIWRPAVAAALNIVVDAEQIPPPMAPVWLLLPPTMTPPIAKPWAASMGPTLPRKLNCWPGLMTCPLKFVAGWRRFLPLPLLMFGVNWVVWLPITTMSARLSMLVICGWIGAVTISRSEEHTYEL